MKKVLQKVWRVIRLIFGVELALAALGGMIASIQSPGAGNIVLTIVCAGVAYLLLRRKKPKAVQISGTPVPGVSVRAEVAPPDVPEEVLRDMRKHYSLMQAQNDAASCRRVFNSASRPIILKHSLAVCSWCRGAPSRSYRQSRLDAKSTGRRSRHVKVRSLRPLPSGWIFWTAFTQSR